ncbi:MAG: TrmH family RNA methyltransferase [Bryobacteraceae bacterium]
MAKFQQNYDYLMLTLTSARNPLLKEVRRAVQRGSLTESGLAVAEGFHLLEEALRGDCEIEAVLVSESVRTALTRHIGGLRQIRVHVLEDPLLREIAATETSQGVIALVRPPAWNIEHLFRGQSLLMILDGVQDPGNMGAILRAAEAFGASGAALLKGSVNPYNPKALRASAGSAFRLPLLMGLDDDLLGASIQQRRLKLYAAMPRAEISAGECDLASPCAILIGGEGQGVRSRLRGAALDIRIPTNGVESLNAAMAAGILLYEARRQRTPK